MHFCHRVEKDKFKIGVEFIVKQGERGNRVSNSNYKNIKKKLQKILRIYVMGKTQVCKCYR